MRVYEIISNFGEKSSMKNISLLEKMEVKDLQTYEQWANKNLEARKTIL